MVTPNIDAAQVVLNYAGQEKLSIDKKGNLLVKTPLGNIMEQKPYSYQVVNGKIIEVPCEFVLNGNNVTFKLGQYNKNAILIIDPVLVFATYSGSITDNFGMTATYGFDGTAYSAGTVFGNAYPTPDNGVFDPNSNFTVPPMVLRMFLFRNMLQMERTCFGLPFLVVGMEIKVPKQPTV
jgi:hypothetical protein